MKLPALLLAALALAGCTRGGEAPPATVEEDDLYLGGGVVELDDDTGGASLWVDIGQNVTTLRMELVYTTVASVNPRVYGLPECEWRIEATHTEQRSDTIDCLRVVPGPHEVRVEHDGGQMTMAVRILGTVVRGP